MKIRIAFVLPNLNPGGAERVTLNLVKLLDKEQFEIHLVVVQDLGSLWDQIPQHVVLHKLNSNRVLFSFWSLFKKLKSIHPDIVQTSSHRLAVVAFCIKRILKNSICFIARLTSTPSLEFKYGEFGKLIKYVYSYTYKNLDCVIAQTKYMKDDATRFFALDDRKVKVLLNPLDIELIENSIYQQPSPFPADTANFIASGRIRHEKGFDTLINAFKIAKKKKPNIKLHIIGDDKGGKKTLEKLIEELALENSVVFHGYQKNPYPFYKYADCFILSSRREGFPNVVLENMYLGKPVIATKCIPVINDLITDGENGFLVDVDDIGAMAKAIVNYYSLLPTSQQNQFNNSDKNISRFYRGLSSCVES